MPPNDLDRAIMAVARSRAAMPDFYRELTKGELWFLIRRHPELEGEVLELKEGSPLPFAMLEDAQGVVVPIYSSEARLEEGLKKGRVPPRTYSAAIMPAVQMLEILGKAELRAVINKFCATGAITIPPNLMRDLADGSALRPLPPGERLHDPLQKLDPADYPTNLIQAAFEFMRRHRNFRAAWIFRPGAGEPEPEPVNGHRYQLLFLMDPRDERVFHDLNLVAQASLGKTDQVRLGLLDEADTAFIARAFREAQPFYVAADYHPPQMPDGVRG
jgi:hypothetical protein